MKTFLIALAVISPCVALCDIPTQLSPSLDGAIARDFTLSDPMIAQTSTNKSAVSVAPPVAPSGKYSGAAIYDVRNKLEATGADVLAYTFTKVLGINGFSLDLHLFAGSTTYGAIAGATNVGKTFQVATNQFIFAADGYDQIQGLKGGLDFEGGYVFQF